MKYLSLIVIIILSIHSTGYSQSADSIPFVPERPGMATPPDIITAKLLDIEDGFQDVRQFEGTRRHDNFMFSSLLLRYGLGKIVEARIQTDFVYNKETINRTTSTIYGLNPITIGSKIHLSEQHNVLPAVSVLCNLTLPYWGQKEFKPKHPAPSIYLLMSNALSERVNLCYNYGIFWDGNSSAPVHFCALCLGFNLTNKLSTFIENYEYFQKQSKPDFFLDAGFAYMINSHFQIDFSAAGYLNSFGNYYLLNAGIAWRI